MGIFYQFQSDFTTGLGKIVLYIQPPFELFDFNLFEIEKEVEKICDHAYKYRFSDPKKSGWIL